LELSRGTRPTLTGAWELSIATFGFRAGPANQDQTYIIYLPRPFPKDGKGIVEGARLERAIDEACKYRGGVHAEAVDWWFTAYNEFRTQNLAGLEQCDVLM